jgi:outer membrane beta-barrel protein
MTRKHIIALSAALAAALLGGTAAPARAERKSLLKDQPAVRHRMLLVKNRFEVAPLFESTINADFKHTISGGLKLEYHFTDMWSAGALGAFGTSINTGLSKRIISTLPENSVDPDPTPSAAEFSDHLNKMPVHGAAFVSLTPWYGKLAAFGKAFVNFDFYFQGGVAFASLKSSCRSVVCSDTMADDDPLTASDNDPNDDPPENAGSRIGIYLGAGIHVFMNDFIALDLTVRNYMFSDNPSGLDFSGNGAVTKNDQRFLSHIFMGLGVSVMLPAKVKRTR